MIYICVIVAIFALSMEIGDKIGLSESISVAIGIGCILIWYICVKAYYKNGYRLTLKKHKIYDWFSVLNKDLKLMYIFCAAKKQKVFYCESMEEMELKEEKLTKGCFTPQFIYDEVVEMIYKEGVRTNFEYITLGEVLSEVYREMYARCNLSGSGKDHLVKVVSCMAVESLYHRWRCWENNRAS